MPLQLRMWEQIKNEFKRCSGYAGTKRNSNSGITFLLKHADSRKHYDHDDVIKRKHFLHYWPFVRGIHRSLHKGQWRGALMFFYLRLIKRLSKHSRGWWFETPSRSLWRHRNYIPVWWKLSISSTMDVVIFRMGPRKVKCLSITTSAKCFHSAYFPAGTRRNNNVFTMSTRRRRRRVDVVKRLSLRHYCVMCPLGLSVSSATADSWQKLFQLPLLISWHAAML